MPNSSPSMPFEPIFTAFPEGTESSSGVYHTIKFFNGRNRLCCTMSLGRGKDDLSRSRSYNHWLIDF